MADPCDHALPDLATAAHLDGETVAAWCVGSDGSSVPWLIVPDSGGQAPGCACATCAPHEQPGRLPIAVRERLGLRCGADTQAGTPCRVWVTRPGDRCHHHHHAAQEADR